MSAIWIVEATANGRFPYRVSIEQAGRLVVAVRAQARWPGPGQQIFCLRERELHPDEPLERIETLPVLQLSRVGRKLTVVLDRPNRKRCEFLTVVKPRAGGTGTYEQIFFRTQSGVRAHRSRGRVELRAAPEELRIVVDSGERYPWRFPGAELSRRKLPAGDYALLDGERIAAVVERKTLENLLTDMAAIQVLHQQLADLASYETAALVIEAEYRDFLDPGRARRWPVEHVSRVMAELSALHPRLPIIYAGNRRLANAWAQRYFRALAARRAQPESQLQLDVERRYDQEPREPGREERIRQAVRARGTTPFTVPGLVAELEDIPAAQIRRVLQRLRAEGEIEVTGKGRGARWQRREDRTP
ncbi:MAG: ERCC4 domain-containing protein [Gemmatimonadales bacterium]